MLEKIKADSLVEFCNKESVVIAFRQPPACRKKGNTSALVTQAQRKTKRWLANTLAD